MLTTHWDSDYNSRYYEISELKSELGWSSGKRNYFERALKESDVLILDWMWDGEVHRMLHEDDLKEFLKFYRNNMPEKLKKKYMQKDTDFYC